MASIFNWVPPEFVPPGITANWQTSPNLVFALGRNLRSGNAESVGKLGQVPLQDYFMADAATIQLTIAPIFPNVAKPGLPPIHRGEVYTV